MPKWAKAAHAALTTSLFATTTQAQPQQTQTQQRNASWLGNTALQGVEYRIKRALDYDCAGWIETI